MPAWGENGIKIIKDFVSSGGIYIGICSGAYVAGSYFDGEAGLHFFDQELKHEIHQEIIEVVDELGNRWNLVSENGPDLSDIKADPVLLQDANGKPQALKINFGKGWVYLFASHPEGSIYYNQPPQAFSGAKFFKNFLESL